MPGINLASPFGRTTANPLDYYSVVPDSTARDAIPDGIRYLGMIVFTIGTEQFWTLKTGLTDADWEEFAGAAAFNGVIDFALSFQYATNSATGSVSNLDMSGYTLVSLTGVTTLQGIDYGSVDPSANPIFILLNDTGADFTIEDMSPSAAVGNKIRTGTGANLVVKQNAAVWGVYVNSVFRLIGGSGGGGAGVGAIDVSNNQTLTNGGFISIYTNVALQTTYVQGTSGPVQLDQFQPFNVQVPDMDGAQITLIGASDDNTVEIFHGDVGQHAAIGPFSSLVLTKDRAVTFMRDNTREKWVLISKNF